MCGGSTNCGRADDEVNIDHVEWEVPVGYLAGYPAGLDFRTENKARDTDDQQRGSFNQ